MFLLEWVINRNQILKLWSYAMMGCDDKTNSQFKK
jgi:hypothetical protein